MFASHSTAIARASRPPGARSRTRCRRSGKAGKFASCSCPDGHDPDSFVNEFGTDAFLEALDEGVPLSEFLIEELASQVDMSDRRRARETGRTGATSRATRSRWASTVNYCIDSLAEAVGLTAAKLEKMLGSGGTRPKSTHARRRRSPVERIETGAGSAVGDRHAITILLNHPQAGLKADIERLASVSRKGTDLLQSPD